MIKKCSVSESDNAAIKEFSAILTSQGIAGAEQYYINEDFPDEPFFRLPKPFKRDDPSEPDTVYLYVDVSGDGDGAEYTVNGSYVHEHVDLDYAVMLISGLLSGAIVEVAVVFPDRLGGFFAANTGDPQKNVDVVRDNIKTIAERLRAPVYAGGQTHMHERFAAANPFFLYTGGTDMPMIDGAKVYMVSLVFGEHPECYIIS